MNENTISPAPTPFDILPMKSFPYVPSLLEWCLLFLAALAVGVFVYFIRNRRGGRVSSMKVYRMTLKDLRTAQSLQTDVPLSHRTVQKISTSVRRYLSVAGVPDALSRTTKEILALQEESSSESVRRLSPILGAIEESRFNPSAHINSAVIDRLLPLVMALEAERSIAATAHEASNTGGK